MADISVLARSAVKGLVQVSSVLAGDATLTYILLFSIMSKMS